MSPRNLSDRLNDIAVAVDAIRSHERRLDDSGIGRDEHVRLDAVIRQLAVIGEAVAHLPKDVKEQEPDIPWADIAGIRIVLDHRYHLVDPKVIWSTVDDDLEPLRQAIDRIRGEGVNGFGDTTPQV